MTGKSKEQWLERLTSQTPSTFPANLGSAPLTPIDLFTALDRIECAFQPARSKVGNKYEGKLTLHSQARPFRFLPSMRFMRA
jgi:hypothetical protein